MCREFYAINGFQTFFLATQFSASKSYATQTGTKYELTKSTEGVREGWACWASQSWSKFWVILDPAHRRSALLWLFFFLNVDITAYLFLFLRGHRKARDPKGPSVVTYFEIYDPLSKMRFWLKKWVNTHVFFIIQTQKPLLFTKKILQKWIFVYLVQFFNKPEVDFWPLPVSFCLKKRPNFSLISFWLSK